MEKVILAVTIGPLAAVKPAIRCLEIPAHAQADSLQRTHER